MTPARLLRFFAAVVMLPSSLLTATDYKFNDKVIAIVDTSLLVNGNQVVANIQTGLILEVAAVNGEWLWVNNGNTNRGWIHPDAVETGELQRNYRHAFPSDWGGKAAGKLTSTNVPDSESNHYGV